MQQFTQAQTVCDTTDLISSFVNIDKPNKFGNMAAPMTLIFSSLKLLLIKHSNIY